MEQEPSEVVSRDFATDARGIGGVGRHDSETAEKPVVIKHRVQLKAVEQP